MLLSRSRALFGSCETQKMKINYLRQRAMIIKVYRILRTDFSTPTTPPTEQRNKIVFIVVYAKEDRRFANERLLWCKSCPVDVRQVFKSKSEDHDEDKIIESKSTGKLPLNCDHNLWLCFQRPTTTSRRRVRKKVDRLLLLHCRRLIIHGPI